MRVFDYREVAAEPVKGAEQTTIRWLISDRTGAPNFAMRVFEVQPGGFSPSHSHWYEQEMFIIAGQGTVTGPAGERPCAPGTVVYIPPGEPHQLKNTGPETLRFICCVPLRKPSGA